MKLHLLVVLFSTHLQQTVSEWKNLYEIWYNI